MGCRRVCAHLLLVLACGCVGARGALPDAVPSDAALNGRDCSGCSNGQSVMGCRCFSDNSSLNPAQGESRQFSAPMKFETVDGEDRILVGAMDAAFVLDYNLDQAVRIDWPTADQERRLCVSVFTSEDAETFICRNHIRHFGVLKGRSPETLMLCGTFSLHQACTYVEASELVGVQSVTPLSARSSIQQEVGSIPTDPRVPYVELPRVLYDNGTDSVIINGVTIYTNTNNYGVIGFNRLFVDQNSKASIDTNMRTDPIKDAHVARPQRFVEIFAHNYMMGAESAADLDFVFVAFQEAESNDNWISRIARVCRNDISSSVLSSNNKGSRVDNNNDEQQFFPMTFVKARISCQIPKQTNADLPYTYNRLRGFQLMSDSTFQQGTPLSQVGYGLFAEGDEVPTGSAVCVYQGERGTGDNNNGLFDIFRKRYINEGVQIDNPSGFNCSDGGRSREANSDYATKNVIEPPMLQIGTPDAPPLFLLNGVQLTRIQVDPRRPVIRGGTVERQDVMFVSSDTGSIYKIFIASDSRPIISERIELDGTEVFNLVLKEDPADNNKYLYSTTVKGVWRVSLSHCERFSTCQDCVAVQDPYCAWTGGAGGTCAAVPADLTAAQAGNYLQNVDTGETTGCPDPPPSSTAASTTPTVSVSSSTSTTPTVTVSSSTSTTPTVSVSSSTSTTPAITVSFTDTVTTTTTEVEIITTIAATATITETTTETKIEPGTNTTTTTTITVGGLSTTSPSSCNGLTAVAAVGSLFIVATVILGGILAALVVLFINDRRGRYGRSQSGKTLQPQLSVEVHTNDSALQDPFPSLPPYRDAQSTN